MGILWNLAARALIQPPVEVSAQRCARSRLVGSDCRRCVDVCPSEAITLETEGGVGVDGLACDGCGLCQGACWSSAFSLRGFTLPAPLNAGEASRGEEGLSPQPAVLQPLRLTCAGQTPSGVVRGGDPIPCLGALDPGRLAELAAGRRLVLAPVIPCAECQWAKGEALAHDNLAVVRRVLANYGIPGEVEWEESLEDSPTARSVLSQAAPADRSRLEDPNGVQEAASSAQSQRGDRVLGRREWLGALGASVRKTVGKTLADSLPGDGGMDLPDVGQRLRRLAARWDRH